MATTPRRTPSPEELSVVKKMDKKKKRESSVETESYTKEIVLKPLCPKPKEDVSKVCGICHETVSKQSCWVMRAPCCKALYHAECMEGSVFLPSRKLFFCARCTEPVYPSVTSLMDKKKDARQRYMIRLESKTQDSSKALDFLFRHLQQNVHFPAAPRKKGASSKTIRRGNGKRKTGALQELHKQWDAWLAKPVTTQGKLPFLQSRKPKVTYNTLVSLGWSLEDIYVNVVDSWPGLVKLGFTMKNLHENQKHMDALVALFDVDVSRLREAYSGIGISIKKIKTLRAETLSILGFSTHCLCTSGMKKSRIASFEALTMEDWVEHMELRPVHVKLLRIKSEDCSKILVARHWNVIRLATLMTPYMKKTPPSRKKVDSMSKKERRSNMKVSRHNDEAYIENILLAPSPVPIRKMNQHQKGKRFKEYDRYSGYVTDVKARNYGQIVVKPRRGYPHYPRNYMHQVGPTYLHGTVYYPSTQHNFVGNGSLSSFRYDNKTSTGHWTQPRVRKQTGKSASSVMRGGGSLKARVFRPRVVVQSKGKESMDDCGDIKE